MTMIAVFITCFMAFASIADAHKGYHYAGLKGTAKNTHETWASMMMPHKPTKVKKSGHVIGWTILWDVGGSEQYVEIGIGYVPRKCKKAVTLWWASPAHPYVNKVACVPFGAWVNVDLQKLDGDETILATWEWNGNAIEKSIRVKGWLTGPGYHPTKAEVYGTHAKHVELHFADIPTFEGDTLDWHIDGPWQPYGTFDMFTVK